MSKDHRAVEKTLCVSTNHMRQEDAAILTEAAKVTASDRLTSLIVYDLKYGFLVYVGTDQEIWKEQIAGAKELGLSDEFVGLMRFAVENECVYLHPDCDGLELEGAPTFDW